MLLGSSERGLHRASREVLIMVDGPSNLYYRAPIFLSESIPTTHYILLGSITTRDFVLGLKVAGAEKFLLLLDWMRGIRSAASEDRLPTSLFRNWKLFVFYQNCIKHVLFFSS